MCDEPVGEAGPVDRLKVAGPLEVGGCDVPVDDCEDPVDATVTVPVEDGWWWRFRWRWPWR